jgi:hypothetical protein
LGSEIFTDNAQYSESGLLYQLHIPEAATKVFLYDGIELGGTTDTKIM